MKKQETVFVGLSGGVDSSVAALRLKKQGYTVVGVFIKVWHPDFMVCNWEAERLDAMRVAAHLEIPFLTCDAEATYRDEVAHYFIDAYKNGRTPNPDVMCNKAVKFGAFLRFAKEHGADYIATGHYAQRKDTPSGPQLLRGIDPNKDQSYFLWSLTPEQLAYTLFPVGNSPKEQIRTEAAKARIPVATKNDSQGICFLGHVDIAEFLSHYITLQEGDVLNETGQIIGTHKGAFVYTVGQRHGFTLHNKDTKQVPHYVTDKNVQANTITVSTSRPDLPAHEQLRLTDVIVRTSIAVGETIEAQIRYRQKPFQVTCSFLDGTEALFIPHDATERPAEGQSCVLYRGSECIGGGIIS